MKKSTILIVALIAFFAVTNFKLQAQSKELQELREIAIIDQKVRIPMRDGVRLVADVYRPKTDKKVPIIFSRTPYNFNNWVDGKEITTIRVRKALEAVKKGYAYIVENERGRYFSEGVWDILGTPVTDGYDTFTWMKNQPWSNGKIATYGCSSSAEWQMAVAALDHPSHAAMVSQGYGAGIGRIGDIYEQGNWYRGGVFQMSFMAWLYRVEHDKFKPRIPKDATQEDLIRISRYYDLDPENPAVDFEQAFDYLPIQDGIKNLKGKTEIFDKMIRREPNDEAWYKGGLYHDDMEIKVPSFWFASWYDMSITPNLKLFNHVRKTTKDKAVRDNQYLIISPNLHCGFTRGSSENTMIGELNVGDARLNYTEQIYDWYDFLLKGEDNDFKAKTPRVQYYTMGSNKWQASETWPPENSKLTTYYLNSNGDANSLYGDGILSTTKAKTNNLDTFTYDPMLPIPSFGGTPCCDDSILRGGAFDHQEEETRDDILVYTSDVLEKGIEVTGFIESTLYVSSDVKDTDFTIKLIDVHPDGKAYNLDETIQRARYREGYEKEVFMKKGEVYKIDLTAMATSNYFKKGHRIRIEISSSNFPRFARNLNTGGNNYDEKEGIVAHNTIHHSSKYPSQIKLPIIKD
ncbi:CocE/NonD family hydrolase [Cellulophaga baltica]|uniref:CocE/NonD family hydrolase n=1 Tax=Cellulophaga TaxID=104264 RepID=UPI001C06EED0|nr:MULTISPECIES: CocE/NonD family hydrolase [Cellulophaga]MBU2996651.1 CocE/NonD family hydrolase [Cellulophaga baltica]MDO6768045.1 CocE/NonD family hydrolase [Cellulophaga sp. 1_MG-2023]